jgi:hypothetical protein
MSSDDTIDANADAEIGGERSVHYLAALCNSRRDIASEDAAHRAEDPASHLKAK